MENKPDSQIRRIHIDQIIDQVAHSFQQACYEMREDVKQGLERAKKMEKSPMGIHVLGQLLENAEMAKKERLAYCHDTGVAVIFMEIGQSVHITGGDLRETLNEGVRRGYTQGYLRASMVRDPFERKNTGDNTPAIIHFDIVPGNQIKIQISAKGGGSENMSRHAMLKPSDGLEGTKDYIVETVSLAGPNACPPLIVGVGVGGNFDYSATLAKKSILREVGSVNPNPFLAELEDEIHERCNKLGIGPQGMGGINTVLDIFIEVEGCHIASLPVAVNLQCPAQRHRTIII